MPAMLHPACSSSGTLDVSSRESNHDPDASATSLCRTQQRRRAATVTTSRSGGQASTAAVVLTAAAIAGWFWWCKRKEREEQNPKKPKRVRITSVWHTWMEARVPCLMTVESLAVLLGHGRV